MKNIFKKFSFEFVIAFFVLIMYKNYIPTWISGWLDADSFYAFGLFLLGFFIYLLKTHFESIKMINKSPDLLGFPLLIIALIIYVLGYRASIHYLVNIAFPIFLSGIVLSLYGKKVFSITIIPIIMFAFAIPILPLYRLTLPLQLIAATFTAKLLNLLGLTAYNEGSAVTVNNYKLLVVAGCSGLKSLSTLIFTTIIYCYFIKASFLRKILVTLASIPLAVAMNMIRITIVGLYAVYNGYEGMEKFHDDMGIFIFIISIGILLLFTKLIEEKDQKEQLDEV